MILHGLEQSPSSVGVYFAAIDLIVSNFSRSFKKAAPFIDMSEVYLDT